MMSDEKKPQESAAQGERRKFGGASKVRDKGVTIGINVNNLLTAVVAALLIGLWNSSSEANSALIKIASTQQLVVYRVEVLEDKTETLENDFGNHKTGDIVDNYERKK